MSKELLFLVLADSHPAHRYRNIRSVVYPTEMVTVPAYKTDRFTIVERLSSRSMLLEDIGI
jgi:hypothetical protein